MQSKMLMDRGKQLFNAKIEGAISECEDKSIIDLLNILAAYFQDHVSVVGYTPRFHKTIEETGDDVEIVYAAARMAQACIDAAFDTSISNSNDLTQKVFDLYNNALVGEHSPVESALSKAEHKAITRSLHQEIVDNSPELDEKDHHVIDMIDCISVDDLTTEGKRARGYLPADFDSTVDDENSYAQPEDEIVEGKVEYDGNQQLMISCPRCGSRNLVVEMSRGICMDCDADFDVSISLADIMIDADEEDDSPGVLYLPGGVVRKIGQKADRGRILDEDDENVYSELRKMKKN